MMKKISNTYLSGVKNPVNKTLWVIFGISILGLLLLTVGYFTGQALYYLTH